jgi:hypothetical protein
MNKKEIKYHKETSHFLTIDETTFEIPYGKPITDHTICVKTRNGFVLGLLYQDSDYDINRMFDEEDGNGKILSFHRNAGSKIHEEAYRAMGRYANEEDPDERIPAAPIFRLLSCYSHSGEQWGLIGEVHQCQWDTAKIAGVWVPDKCAEENIKALTANSSEEDKKLIIDKYVRNIMKRWNCYLSGDIYGIAVCEYRQIGNTLTRLSEDACWGYEGSEFAISEMKAAVNIEVDNPTNLQKKGRKKRVN